MKTYVIAEIGINHNGDVNLAKELILQSKNSGCDAVKFQKRDVEVVYSSEELDTPRESPFGTTTREQKHGIELSIDEFKELESYSKELGLDFIVSCWDLNSLEQIEEHCDVKFHKVASALATDKTFLERLRDTNVPIILSTGMCTEEEIKKAVDILGENLVFLLACTSTYPTKPEEVNLRHITTLKEKYPELKIGFSNHHNGHDACISSIVLGSECVEFHITQNRTMYGSDQVASIQDSDELVSGIRKMELMVGDGVKKVYDTEKPIADKLRKVNDI
tara:strand:- start:4224 stop:5054 length:831 start_codon:yes stop_codon:yes gene_type:complete